MAARDGTEDMNECIAAGMNGYITKLIGPKVLLKTNEEQFNEEASQ